jgi:hypothetical protein
MTSPALRLFAIRLAMPLVCAFLLSSCGVTSGLSFGVSRPEVHEVSVHELLGRPSDFDDQPVRVIGVAGFDSGFEGRLRIYTSTEDQRHLSNSFVRIAELSPTLGAKPEDLAKLTGTFVIVEGIFHATPLRRIPESTGARTVCTGDCGTSGILVDVNRVSRWEF